MTRNELKEIISAVVTKLQNGNPAAACGMFWADEVVIDPTTRYAIGEEDPTTKYAIGEEDPTTLYSVGEEDPVTRYAIKEEI